MRLPCEELAPSLSESHAFDNVNGSLDSEIVEKHLQSAIDMSLTGA
jgi:hypothetical protein